jgi:hypothetical protein
MTTILRERLSALDGLVLHSGNGGMNAPCIMDVVDYITGGDGKNDHPACASRVISGFAIMINDSERFAEYRNELLPYAVRIAGTTGTIEQEIKRVCMVADWAVRVAAPMALDSAGLHEQAQILRNVGVIYDRATARAAADAANYAANTAADAAYYVANTAANAAARVANAAADAARAARAAARAAADAAARVANYAADAAADAANYAANTAADAAYYVADAAANAAARVANAAARVANYAADAAADAANYAANTAADAAYYVADAAANAAARVARAAANVANVADAANAARAAANAANYTQRAAWAASLELLNSLIKVTETEIE